VCDGVKTMNDVNIATEVRKYYEAETGKDLWVKPFINMRSSCIIELIEIHKYSEYEVSQCVENSPQTIRKHYMDLLRADHKREAEQELVNGNPSSRGDKRGDTCPVPPEFVVNLNGSQYVPIEAVQAMLEEQKTLRKQHISELLASAPECVVPLRAAIEEMAKVHHRGVAITAQDHGKHRVGRIKAVSVGDNVGDTLPCPSENASDETGHADIESVVARFRDTHFALTPATAESVPEAQPSVGTRVAQSPA